MPPSECPNNGKNSAEPAFGITKNVTDILEGTYVPGSKGKRQVKQSTLDIIREQAKIKSLTPKQLNNLIKELEVKHKDTKAND